MSIIGSNILAGASGQVTAAADTKSLRFNSGDSASLTRTPSSAGNRRTWTWSGWVKRGKLGISATLFASRPTSSPLAIFYFSDQDYLRFDTDSNSFGSLQTNAVFRDCSAWYHVVLAVDSSQSTNTDRLKLYVNGVQQTFASVTYPGQNTDGQINTATLHGIGAINPSTYTDYFDGYLADVHFVDGQQLTAGDFAETDATTGQWVPKEYTFSTPLTIEVGTPSYPSDFTTTGNKTSDQTGLSFGTWSGSYTGAETKIFKASDDSVFEFNLSLSGGSTDRYLWYSDNLNDWTYIGNTNPNRYYRLTGHKYYATSEGSGSTTLYAKSDGFASFHLDFSDNSSASALGTDASTNGNNWTVNNISVTEGNGFYAQYLTAASGGFDLGFEPTKAFDGSTGTYARVATAATNMTFSPSSSISYSSSVEVRMPTSDANISINGGAASFVAGGPSWATIATGSGSISSLVFSTTGPSDKLTLAGIRIDGSYLLDYAINAGIDSLFDSPTNGTQTDTGAGGEVSGNYATLNPLIEYTRAALTNGNLDANQASSSTAYAQGTIVPSSGKWFFEATCTAALISGTTSMRVGVAKVGSVASSSIAIYNGGDGQYEIFGSNTSGKATYTNGDVVGIALDIDAGTIQFYKNGSSQGSTSITAGVAYIPHVQLYAASCVFNFGQRAFAYTAPSGYKALCTANLDDPTIADGSTAMDVALYTGTGSTQSITGLNFSPDMVWLKARGGTYGTYYHRITDIVRGAAKELYTNETLSETNSPNGLNAFNSDGWTLGTEVGVNGSSTTYVGWAWDAGSSTVSNTNGSITSSVRANVSAGFSIVTYTGNGTAGATVGHGLGVTPEMIIIKQRTGTFAWRVYHKDLGNTNVIFLNLTNASTTDSAAWNNTSPTSSTITFGNSQGVNGTSSDYVAYCFAEVEGYSKFGSYTGNGSTDGPFVYTGHRSRWLMVKRTDTSSQWSIWDTERNTYNAAGTNLWADSSEIEATSVNYEADFLSNGFKMRNSHAARNASGGTYIWASFAEHPFKYARAR